MADLKRLQPEEMRMILRILSERLSVREDPHIFGRHLSGELGMLWVFRLGSQRVLCRLLEEETTIIVVMVTNRAKGR